MTLKIFYSWQSDTKPAAACRTFIQLALEAAAREIGEEGVVEPVVDRDTLDVPGCPDIGATILSKIDAAAVLVADVTIVGTTCAGKPTPNPNVLLEVGYALKTLGWERIILVLNEAFGKPEHLPFDLRQKRAVVYASPGIEGVDRSRERNELQKKLYNALASIAGLGTQSSSGVELSLDYVKKQESTDAVHHYELQATLKNGGESRWEDWALEVEAPTSLLNTGVIYTSKIDKRSDLKRSLFRISSEQMKKSVLPGDNCSISLGYRIDESAYLKWKKELFSQLVTTRAYVDGRLLAKVERRVEDLQNY